MSKDEMKKEEKKKEDIMLRYLLKILSYRTGKSDRWTINHEDVVNEFRSASCLFDKKEEFFSWLQEKRSEFKQLISACEDILEIRDMGDYFWLCPKKLPEDVADFISGLDMHVVYKRQILSKVTEGFFIREALMGRQKLLNVWNYYLLKLAEKWGLTEKIELSGHDCYKELCWNIEKAYMVDVPSPYLIWRYMLFVEASVLEEKNRVLERKYTIYDLHSIGGPHELEEYRKKYIPLTLTAMVAKLHTLLSAIKRCREALAELLPQLFTSSRPEATPHNLYFYIDLRQPYDTRKASAWMYALMKLFHDITLSHTAISIRSNGTASALVFIQPAVTPLREELEVLELFNMEHFFCRGAEPIAVLGEFSSAVMKKILQVGKTSAAWCCGLLFPELQRKINIF